MMKTALQSDLQIAIKSELSHLNNMLYDLLDDGSSIRSIGVPQPRLTSPGHPSSTLELAIPIWDLRYAWLNAWAYSSPSYTAKDVENQRFECLITGKCYQRTVYLGGVGRF
jgi:hypothetical protein